jgi:hypothetical protein
MDCRSRSQVVAMTLRLPGMRRFGTTRAIVLSRHENLRHKRAAGLHVAMRRVAMLNAAMERGRERYAIF